MRDRKDPFYRLAREQSYRSRAAFKLLELQDKFSLISPGDVVLDLGASPGGWSQVAHQLSGKTVVSVDRNPVPEEEWNRYLRADITDPGFPEKLSAVATELGIARFNCIISDAMVHTSGNPGRDHASSFVLCEGIMKVVLRFLKNGGNAVIKQFYGDMTKEFMQNWSRKFKFSKVTSVTATRKGSSEVYIVFKELL
ncbi:MAG: RlmE family RNA methyltransferase [Candidatus Thermoplasmatota archaeon]|jgi:23S rRNA (uridine2552-2'-O)-methyltransferase|nr:RlmE family RNA methyltransferase [Candidatus Thermoplasmatota archaeon]MCL5786132.1 RlmE family RNA methyltransferase [Candidatus Thermoplasmatota archaeon]